MVYLQPLGGNNTSIYLTIFVSCPATSNDIKIMKDNQRRWIVNGFVDLSQRYPN